MFEDPFVLVFLEMDRLTSPSGPFIQRTLNLFYKCQAVTSEILMTLLP
jgi:hypothetical protein